ncbi:proteasome regulatory particle base subunit RPN10 ASCRUDRAFT_30335 [Ascoidea rubescens DSM 1968]|uniref:VWFA domain-containing protein n=1 Tax=Ascoidea rubescens DSM 1968 TaxID=1344418 RepID=A0A1D2VP04_9ASCO|nr:hypothetical protein ASCRUDRAFT_30335 [Ascoidea rubescens DSM 1968]ODV63324.1 hypothetical protein ASCRUDRAFT_30335 [Ascoidea rubescens DSM 1968]
MVLEATMIVIDNSEHMRNGDYFPTRFEAQLETVDFIFHAKTDSNPESTVGLLAMAGQGPQVLSTLTNDLGKIRAGIHETKIHGTSQLTTGIQVAALVLKHRENKSQQQRIIVFIGSPVNNTQRELEKLAKRMKKNNIAVDFICFGEESLDDPKLAKFISTVNNHDNSHIVSVPVGPTLLYDAVKTSPIISDNANNYTMDGDDFLNFGDGADPELELALRLSLEDERARQERAAALAAAKNSTPLEKVDEESSTKDKK